MRCDGAAFWIYFWKYDFLKENDKLLFHPWIHTLHLKLNSRASESFILTWSYGVAITYFFPCKLRGVQNIFHGKRCFVDKRQFGFSWLHFSLQWSAKGTSNQCWCLCLYVLPLRTPPGRFEIYMSFKQIPKWSNASSRNNSTQRPPCADDLWDPPALQNVNVRPQGWGWVVWCGGAVIYCSGSG